MGIAIRPARLVAVAAVVAATLLASAASAPARRGRVNARSLTKQLTAVVSIAAGAARSLAVPFPDALEYGNARYSGASRVLPPRPGTRGRSPDLADVKVLAASAVEGGSEYEVRVRNGNPAGTAAVRLEVIATTIEPLPHS